MAASDLPRVSTVPTARSQPLHVREQILKQATRLFAERGYEGTALQDIADRVGVRKQSLLHYFATKEALRQAVLEEELLARWKDVLPRVLLAASAGDDQFDAVMQELIGFFSREPDRARVLAREMLDRPKVVGQLVRKHVTPWIDVVCEHIRRGQARGHLHADVDPEAYVTQVTLLLLACVASQPALGFLGSERGLKEMLRIARSSLFRPTGGSTEE